MPLAQREPWKPPKPPDPPEKKTTSFPADVLGSQLCFPSLKDLEPTPQNPVSLVDPTYGLDKTQTPANQEDPEKELRGTGARSKEPEKNTKG